MNDPVFMAWRVLRGCEADEIVPVQVLQRTVPRVSTFSGEIKDARLFTTAYFHHYSSGFHRD